MRLANRRNVLGGMAGLLLLVGSAAMGAFVASDRPIIFFQPSQFHTVSGLSQLIVGPLGGEQFPIRLTNPGPEPHVATVLLYTSPRLNDPGNVADFEPDFTGAAVEPGRFLGCLNLTLDPLESLELEDDFFTDDLPPNDGSNVINLATDVRPAVNPARARAYVQILSVPVDRVERDGVGSRFGRRADRLGLLHADGEEGTDLTGIDPGLFRLPSAATAAGDRQAAIDCMCEAAVALGDFYVWNDFGLVCRP